MKSFDEIMREKQQKRAAQINSGNKDVEDSAAAESKQTSAAAAKHPRKVQKTKPAPARKYKFTPIVFDLNSKVSEKANVGDAVEQVRRKSLETVGSSASGSVTVPVRKRLSISIATQAASDSSVAVTDVSTEQSAALKSSVLTAETETAPAERTESSLLFDESETRITPVIKRQSSSSAHTPSDVSKKRRTSVDSR